LVHQERCRFEISQTGDDIFIRAGPQTLGKKERQHLSGDDLGVKSLAGSDGHFNIPSIACVEHTMRFGRDVRLTAVDNRNNVGAAFFGHRHGAIGIGCCSRLCNRNDQRIGQIIFQTEAAQLRGNARCDMERR